MGIFKKVLPSRLRLKVPITYLKHEVAVMFLFILHLELG